MADARSDLLEIGRITRPHGLRGELRVHLHWEDSAALRQVKEVVLPGRVPERREVLGARSGGKAFLLKLAGVESIEAAEQLRDTLVCVERTALPAPAEDEYYLVDLLGATVSAPDGDVGTVVEIGQHPSCDTLVIETADGERVEQPLLPEWVDTVDDKAGRVLLLSRDGLI